MDVYTRQDKPMRFGRRLLKRYYIKLKVLNIILYTLEILNLEICICIFCRVRFNFFFFFFSNYSFCADFNKNMTALINVIFGDAPLWNIKRYTSELMFLSCHAKLSTAHCLLYTINLKTISRL